MKNSLTFYYKLKNKKIKIKKNFPSTNDISFLRSEKYIMERDVYSIACSVFLFEKLIRQNAAIESLEIPISKQSHNLINVDVIEKTLEKLILDVLYYDVKVNLIPKKLKFTRTRINKFSFEKSDAICLFSGGADSFSGLLNTKNKFERVTPLFLAHSDQQGMIHIVKNLNERYFNNKKLTIKMMHVPAITKGGYSQLRGFLYFMLGGLYANISGTSKMIVTECGPTMYQPRFFPMDQITFTTHPMVLNATNKVLNSIFKKIEIVTPFENLTKAETIAASPDKSYFSNTHSCITQRLRDHDGTCYGCVIRKLGALTAGVKDTTYNFNVLSEDNSYKRSDNFVALLNACYDIILNYEEIPDFTRDNIDTYDKYDLFKRFALDNFSALYIYYNSLKKKKSKFVDNIFQKAIQNIGEDNLKNRINEVRKGKITPDFMRIVT